MAERKKPLRWRRQPDNQGLAAIGQPPRGAELRIGEKILAHVYPYSKSTWGRKDYEGWYWVAASRTYDIPLKNTCHDPLPTIEEAKAAAKTYVLEHLKR
jgi:hypothetical protein